ncbi:MAG TPA: hypothetical protein VEB18_01045 [Candidatus Paceibacterota bacterium]|nr:hypothetical protein [Candidatus Paceibacterota bacterium]
MYKYLAILLLAASPLIVSAQEFIPLTGLPGLNEIQSAASSSLPDFFNMLYRLCIGAATTIAIFQIIRAGFKSIMQEGSVLQQGEVRDMITSAIFGLVLVLSPAIVFGIIDPRILNLSLNLEGLKIQEASFDTTVEEARDRCGVIEEGRQVPEDLRYCCTDNGFRADPGRHGYYVCTNAAQMDDDDSATIGNGQHYRNVPVTQGEYSFLLYYFSEGDECIQLVLGSYDDQESCSAAFTETTTERPSYQFAHQCRVNEGTRITTFTASVPYCSDIDSP